MLDVHVIVSDDTPVEWVRECLSSIRVAIEMTDYPIAFRKVAGVPGHIGKARAEGYALGDYPYVTCVDDDDYVLPHAFSQLCAHIKRANTAAIATPELLLRNHHFERGKDIHHLIAYRRDVLINHASWTCCGDVSQIHAVSRSDIEIAPLPAYVHRVYTSRARKMRRNHPYELELAHG